MGRGGGRTKRDDEEKEEDMLSGSLQGAWSGEVVL